MKTSITKPQLPASRKAFAGVATALHGQYAILLPCASKSLLKNIIKNPE